MSWDSIFPDLSPEEIHRRVSLRWDLESWAYPIPRHQIVCSCGSIQWHARSWSFLDRRKKRDGVRVRFRCNISMKCTFCGLVCVWGIAIPDKYAVQRMSWHKVTNVQWREALEIAQEHGYPSKPPGDRA